MEKPKIEFTTPLPGVEVPKQQADLFIKAFSAKFRESDPAKTPTNIPTACLLKGRKDLEYLSNTRFLNRKEILFYVECAHQLHRTTPTSAASYFSAREPWENYDVCLFDESLKWCVGVTHNDAIIVANKTTGVTS